MSKFSADSELEEAINILWEEKWQKEAEGN